MIKWDKPCYKCLSHFCDLSCKEPKHLQAPQRQPLKYEEYSALAETYTIDYGLLDCVDNHLYKPLQGIKE